VANGIARGVSATTERGPPSILYGAVVFLSSFIFLYSSEDIAMAPSTLGRTALLLLLLVAAARTSAAVEYAITDLGTLGVQQPRDSYAMDFSEVRAINASGQIVGWGRNPDGQDRAFLLTPIPEPATAALLISGLLALAALGRRKERTR
jgi:probable HAF family extracellular repeat protein